MLPMDRRAFRAPFFRAAERRSEHHSNRNSNAQPNRHVPDHHPGGRAQRRAQRRSQRNTQSRIFRFARHLLAPESCRQKKGKRDESKLAPRPDYFAASTTGGFGVLSPICRTFPSSSASGMPESVSNNAGTCAAILAMSAVILFIPDASPFPVETMVILSTFASGLASAFTISGMVENNLSITAAWLYS